MYDYLQLLALFTRDLLEVDETIIKFSRDNNYNDNFNKNLLVIDSLGASQRLNNSSRFLNETMEYSQQYRIPCTIDFYGEDAWELSNKFSLLIFSQQAFELKKKYKIAVLGVSTFTNLKQLVGTQYAERYQLQFNLLYTIEFKNGILNINSAEVKPLLVGK